MIKEKREGLDPIFCRIDSRFMYWYNAKYDREEHLFQDRYRAESIDNEEYLFTVLRYIHQNPVKASLCETVDLPLLQVMDTNGKKVLFRDLPEIFDLSFLGEIQLSSKRIIIKPRKNAFTKDLTPITFELPYFPDKK